MNVHTEWNCLIPILSSLSSVACFRVVRISGKLKSQPYQDQLFLKHSLQDENEQIINVHTKWNCLLIHTSGKITTVPRQHSLQNENKHQIMNAHTKWNCSIDLHPDLNMHGYSFSKYSVLMWLSLVDPRVSAVGDTLSLQGEVEIAF